MRRLKWTGHDLVDFATTGLLVALIVGCAGGADHPHRIDGSDAHAQHVASRGPASAEPGIMTAQDLLRGALEQVRPIGRRLIVWYLQTPPADRVTWGGMTACAGLGLSVLVERLVRLRRGKIVPPEFTARFLDRLHEGKLDCGKALDHCELNPSPAARVALAAVRRWDRPPADQERAVGMAHRVESDRLKRNVGTLRRIAVLAPLLGLLGTLFALGRALERIQEVPTPQVHQATTAGWGPLLAAALTPLSAGIIIATLALVAYDGLLTRVEKLAGALDRLGAETIDAIALTAPIATPMMTIAAVPALARTPHQPSPRSEAPADRAVGVDEHENGF